jgi:hypothetical protein
MRAGVRKGLIGREGVINDVKVRAAVGENSSHRGCQSEALLSGHELHGLSVSGEAGGRKQRLAPIVIELERQSIASLFARSGA